MKKNKIVSLMALVMAGMVSLVGCGSDSKKTSSNSNGEVYTIGINQLAYHPALDDARRGFEDG